MQQETGIGSLRWSVKKAARRMAAMAGLSGAGRESGSLRILTYHRFGDAVKDPFCVSAGEFSRQMAYLSRHHTVLRGDDVLGYLEGTCAIPSGSIWVTIDDGDPSVLEIACPILKHHGIPAMLFAITGRIGQPDHLDATQLRQLKDYDVEVGSHSVSHPFMASLSELRMREELVRSRETLQQLLGEEVSAFAYPYGTRAAYSTQTTAALRNAGYRMALTSQHGAVRQTDDPLQLSRIKIEGGDPAWLFEAACQGAMDCWKYVDAALSSIQKPPRPAVTAQIYKGETCPGKP